MGALAAVAQGDGLVEIDLQSLAGQARLLLLGLDAAVELGVLAVEQHRLVPVHLHGDRLGELVTLEVGQRFHLDRTDPGHPDLVGGLVDVHLGAHDQLAVHAQLGKVARDREQVALGRAGELQGFAPDIQAFLVGPHRVLPHLDCPLAAKAVQAVPVIHAEDPSLDGPRGQVERTGWGLGILVAAQPQTKGVARAGGRRTWHRGVPACWA